MTFPPWVDILFEREGYGIREGSLSNKKNETAQGIVGKSLSGRLILVWIGRTGGFL